MSFINELKAEIVRQARKEIKKELEPVKRVNASQRKFIADLRREINALQKEIALVRRTVPDEVRPDVADDSRQGFWMTGKGVRSLRKRLGITQTDLAKLADVTQQTVVRWEKAEGKVPFRGEATIARMQELRTMNKRAAQEKLAAD